VELPVQWRHRETHEARPR